MMRLVIEFFKKSYTIPYSNSFTVSEQNSPEFIKQVRVRVLIRGPDFIRFKSGFGSGFFLACSGPGTVPHPDSVSIHFPGKYEEDLIKMKALLCLQYFHHNISP